ncbi:phage tail protein [Actinoplanes sp. M2I2]|uniref:phage tail protein n=1 Tax=Actinoplanes sp. M2I2 TaxID=1734444 RepID=UPI0020224DAC|nr:phage tail protein [Actinoplanes sp. M2I2]
MATFRDNPYPGFNFIVSLGGDTGSGDEGTIVGGFSDVSGLSFTVQYADYRNGNEKVNTVRKVQNTFTVEDVTCKRGVIGSLDLFAWLEDVSRGTSDARTVTISLLDEARSTVSTWKLLQAQPKKWTGPTLSGKGGTEVAMEELVLCCQQIQFV